MICPPLLSAGDKVAIVAPSGRIENKDLTGAERILNSWGLKSQFGDHVFDQNNFFSSTDEGRRKDLQNALDDPDIRAILCARGGYGLGRILDSLNFENFLDSPKWVIGFSDITLIHLYLHKIGVGSIHGPMANQINHRADAVSMDNLKQMIFHGNGIEYSIPANEHNISGESCGPVVGGNLTLICNNIGTSSDIDFDGKILLIEETDEKLYAVDRYLNQLDRSGRLRVISGLIVGQFTNIRDTDPSYGKSVFQIITEYAAKYRIPVCFGLETGHEKRNLPVPISFSCNLEVNPKGSIIKFSK